MNQIEAVRNRSHPSKQAGREKLRKMEVGYTEDNQTGCSDAVSVIQSCRVKQIRNWQAGKAVEHNGDYEEGYSPDRSQACHRPSQVGQMLCTQRADEK